MYLAEEKIFDKDSIHMLKQTINVDPKNVVDTGNVGVFHCIGTKHHIACHINN